MRRFQHIAWSLFEVIHLPLLMVRWRSSTLAVLVKMRAFHDPKGVYRYLERHGAWSRWEKDSRSKTLQWTVNLIFFLLRLIYFMLMIIINIKKISYLYV